MPESKYVMIPEEPQVSTGKDLLTLVLAFAGAIKLLLASFDIQIPADRWEAILNIISLGFAAWGIYKNTYALSTKAKQQKAVLIQAGLKEEQSGDN